MAVNITLFNLKGERLDTPILTLDGKEVRILDLRELTKNAGVEFQQGSVQVHYIGMERELAAMLKLINAGRSLIFDEQLIEPGEYFESSRLEGAWWLPSHKAEMAIVVSNTTATPLSVTLAISGIAPKQKEPKVISLLPNETRVIDAKKLSDKQGGTLAEAGGISINHTGAPGGLFACALIQEPSVGFSSIIEFRDPLAAKSSRLDGAGLRIGKVGGEELSQVAVARNLADGPTTLHGHIVYTANKGGWTRL